MKAEVFEFPPFSFPEGRVLRGKVRGWGDFDDDQAQAGQARKSLQFRGRGTGGCVFAVQRFA
ncbi:hypothetical protein DTL42_17030 [Bremerella cremea]|uniref:Uncharacterized protein n=1 Tax=Bremerella cremea TaxID=1031537 RepID=A0A368KN50_9BACT|nr:hypothetical protein DTL42_17030 [Bremerella cremea]